MGKQYTMKNFIKNLNFVTGVKYPDDKKGKSRCDNIGFAVY
jgi:hypothetical protein